MLSLKLVSGPSSWRYSSMGSRRTRMAARYPRAVAAVRVPSRASRPRDRSRGRAGVEGEGRVVAAQVVRNRIGAMAAVLALVLSVLVVASPSPVGAIVAFSTRGSINQV